MPTESGRLLGLLSHSMPAQENIARTYAPVPAHQELTKQFAACDAADDRGRWDELWRAEKRPPWDQGCPNPALVRLVQSVLSRTQHGPPSHVPGLIPEPIDRITGRTRKALVPGCGRGYDVHLLASAGFDVVGLDTSEHAIAAAEAWIEAHGSPQGEAGEEGPSGFGRGSVRLVCGDFFQGEWNEGAESGFDLIYDYTFFCALPPALRPAWARRMSQLLSRDPHAALVCVEYPLFKPPSTGGPPFGVSSEMYEQHLGRPGETVTYDSDGHVIPEIDGSGCVMKREKGLVRFAHYMPGDTHELGRGKSWISVWRHSTVMI